MLACDTQRVGQVPGGILGSLHDQGTWFNLCLWKVDPGSSKLMHSLTPACKQVANCLFTCPSSDPAGEPLRCQAEDLPWQNVPWAAENDGLSSPMSASSDSYCSLVLPRPGSAGLCFLCCMILQLVPLKTGPSRPHWLVALPWHREVNSHSLGLGLERSISHHAAGQALQPSFTSSDLQLKPGPALSSHTRPCNPATLCLGLLSQTQFRALTLVYRTDPGISQGRMKSVF